MLAEAEEKARQRKEKLLHLRRNAEERVQQMHEEASKLERLA
jgi:hypothetical protein